MTPRYLHWPTAAGGGAWTPASLSSLRAWFDADALTGLADGDAMSSWSDSSGNANNVSNTQTTTKPTYETNELNGKSVVRFYASSGFLGQSTIYAAATPSMQVIVVAKTNTISGTTSILSANNYTPNIRLSSNNVQAVLIYGGASQTGSQAGVTTGAWFIASGMVDLGNSIGSAGLNGATPSTVALTNSVATIGPHSSVPLTVGTRYTETALPFDGDIAEVVVITNDNTSQSRQTVEGYLAHKWGLTSNLPGTHPYKSSAP
jgi:hypothetical protein